MAIDDTQMHRLHVDADARDLLLIEAHDYVTLIAAYYPQIVARLALRTDEYYEVAHQTMMHLLGELERGKRYTVPFRVVVAKRTDWTLRSWRSRWTTERALPSGVAPSPGTTDAIREYAATSLVTDDPAEIVAGNELIDDALDGLPPREREVMSLLMIEGRDRREIAAMLDISENNVYQCIHRFRQRYAKDTHVEP